MGHKVHPIGFRLGILYPWQSKWYADKNYTSLLHEDLSIRKMVLDRLHDAVHVDQDGIVDAGKAKPAGGSTIVPTSGAEVEKAPDPSPPNAPGITGWV